MQSCPAIQHQVNMPSWLSKVPSWLRKNALFLSQSAFSNFAPHVITDWNRLHTVLLLFLMMILPTLSLLDLKAFWQFWQALTSSACCHRTPVSDSWIWAICIWDKGNKNNNWHTRIKSHCKGSRTTQSICTWELTLPGWKRVFCVCLPLHCLHVMT